jgi:branched-chain amino acid transport system permease protein
VTSVTAAGLPGTIADRWRDMSGTRRAQVIVGAIVVLYVILAFATGKHGYIHHKAPIGIVLLGVVYGSVTALGAFGLILVYRANRFINFAHGAMGSLVGVLAIGLVKVHGLNYWIALVLAVVVGGLLGGFIEVSTIRRFSNSSRLIATVASIGLAQALGGTELIGSKHEGFTALTGAFNPPFNLSVRIDVWTFHSAEILVVMVVPAVIAFLAWFLLRTNAGVAVRAAAENSDRALLLGIPVRRLATIVWIIAGSLAALTYMLQAPFEGVKPGVTSNGPTVFLPIVAAAVVARMESLPTAFASSIGLGIMYQVVYWNSKGSPSLVWPIYLGVIVVALLAQSGKLSRAQVSGTSSWSAVGALKPIPDELRRLPEVMWGKRALLAALAVAAVWIPHTWGASNQLLAGYAMVWALLGVSLVVLTGWGGDISLGQFGIAGVAGLVAANMVAHWNADFLLVILAAGATGAGVALLIGLPALRIRGLFLGVTTLALAVALDEYFINTSNFPQFIPSAGVTRPLLLQRFDLNNDYEMYVVCLIFLVLSILAAVGLRKARAGRVLIATKDNQRAAEASAVPTTTVKLAGFAVSGVIAGVAGALDVLLLQAISPGSFPSFDSITAFCYAVIGGLGSITGALIGVLTFKYLESITALGQIHLLISGVALLWVLSVFPGGLGQLVYAGRDKLLKLIADRRGILVPSLVADKRQPGSTAADDRGLLMGALGGARDEPAWEGNGEVDPTVPIEVGT